MKEYFQKIVAWAKANPWLAAGILGVVILFVWLAIKNNWFGGGGGGGTGAAGSPEPGDGGEATLPDMSNLPGVSEIGQSSSPIPVQMESAQPSSFASLPSMDMGLGSMGDYLPSVPAFEPGYVENYAMGAPVKSSSSMSLAEVAAPSPSASLGGGFFSGVLSYGSTKQELPTSILSSEGAPSLFEQLLAPVSFDKPADKPAQAKKKQASTKSKTPAQERGKGARFTGYIDGVYYVNGYPAASSSLAATTKLKPSAGAQVSPTQGGGFFTGQYLTPQFGSDNKNTAAATTAGALKNKKGGSI